MLLLIFLSFFGLSSKFISIDYTFPIKKHKKFFFVTKGMLFKEVSYNKEYMAALALFLQFRHKYVTVNIGSPLINTLSFFSLRVLMLEFFRHKKITYKNYYKTNKYDVFYGIRLLIDKNISASIVFGYKIISKKVKVDIDYTFRDKALLSSFKKKRERAENKDSVNVKHGLSGISDDKYNKYNKYNDSKDFIEIRSKHIGLLHLPIGQFLEEIGFDPLKHSKIFILSELFSSSIPSYMFFYEKNIKSFIYSLLTVVEGGDLFIGGKIYSCKNLSFYFVGDIDKIKGNIELNQISGRIRQEEESVDYNRVREMSNMDAEFIFSETYSKELCIKSVLDEFIKNVKEAGDRKYIVLRGKSGAGKTFLINKAREEGYLNQFNEVFFINFNNIQEAISNELGFLRFSSTIDISRYATRAVDIKGKGKAIIFVDEADKLFALYEKNCCVSLHRNITFVFVGAFENVVETYKYSNNVIEQSLRVKSYNEFLGFTNYSYRGVSTFINGIFLLENMRGALKVEGMINNTFKRVLRSVVTKSNNHLVKNSKGELSLFLYSELESLALKVEKNGYRENLEVLSKIFSSKNSLFKFVFSDDRTIKSMSDELSNRIKKLVDNINKDGCSVTVENKAFVGTAIELQSFISEDFKDWTDKISDKIADNINKGRSSSNEDKAFLDSLPGVFSTLSGSAGDADID